MNGVAAQRDMFKVAPPPDEVLDAVFGTRTPSSEAVAAAIKAGALDLYDRWEGVYVISYQDAAPHEIFFCGFSGD